MEPFDERVALRVGGRDSDRAGNSEGAGPARILAVASCPTAAAALVDPFGEGTALELDEYSAGPDGAWRAGTSGSAGEAGNAWWSGAYAAWGQGPAGGTVGVEYRAARHQVAVSASGWWLFVAPGPARWPEARECPPPRPVTPGGLS